MYCPVIAAAMDDAAGVGPEAIMKCLAGRDFYEHCRPLVIASPLRRLPNVRVPIVDPGSIAPASVVFGTAGYPAHAATSHIRTSVRA